MSRGWPYESARHSLAARGIRSRGLIYPSGKPNNIQINRIFRIEKTIDSLARLIKNQGLKEPGKKSGIYGGLTSSDFIDTRDLTYFGDIDIELDPKVMLRYNNLISVEYTKEFFKNNPNIAKWISSKTRAWNAIFYVDEKELVSMEPIKIPIQAIKKIDINYAIKDPTHNSVLGEYIEFKTETETYEYAKKISKEIKKKIPRGYWDLIWLNNTTTGERQKLTWLI